MKYVLTTEDSVVAYSSLKCSQIEIFIKISHVWSFLLGLVAFCHMLKLPCADLRHNSFAVHTVPFYFMIVTV